MFATSVLRSSYPAYKSPYGPKYQYQPHIDGITPKQLYRLLPTAAAWSGVALFAVIYYASGIPKVRKDVLERVPYLGEKYFVQNEIPASDNPF